MGFLPHSAQTKDLLYPKGIKGWAAEWYYIYQRVNQPANQPTSQSDLESNFNISATTDLELELGGQKQN